MAVDPINAKQESFGAQLNRMSGVVTEKNLYEPKNKMDKDAFLKMFTEQLKNQDPLNPTNNEQFSQQMAMFAQLEQQMATNKNLEKMISQQSNMQIAALQLVGKNIVADKAGLYHDKEKHSTINFKLPADASELKVQVTDLNGQTVKTIDLGAKNAGDVSTKWDGLAEEGRPMESGRYSYKILAKGADGKEMSVPTKVDGRVNGVTTDKGVVFLLVGDQKVGLNDVETIKDPSMDTPKVDAIAKNPNDAKMSDAGPSVAATKVPEIAVNLDGKPAGTESENKTKEDSSDLEPRLEDDRLNSMMPLFFR